MPYAAIVTRIKTKPHPNADKLLLGEVHGHQVVVGLDTEDNELPAVLLPANQLVRLPGI